MEMNNIFCFVKENEMNTHEYVILR